MLLKIRCLSWFKYLIMYRDKNELWGSLADLRFVKVGHDTGESKKIKMFSMLKKD